MKAKTPLPDDAFTEELWVYAGRRMSKSGLQDGFYQVATQTGDQLAGSTLLSFEQLKGAARTVGGIYRVPVARKDERVVIRFSMMQFVRMLPTDSWGHDKLVLEWKLLHDAALLLKDMAGVERKGKELHLELLKPLRDAYQNSSFSQQAAIEALVLRYIRRGV